MDTSQLQALEWRSIGPFRGGRAPSVVGHPTERATFFFGACAGGVWKSTDAGSYWENVSDGYLQDLSRRRARHRRERPQRYLRRHGRDSKFAATSHTAMASTRSHRRRRDLVALRPVDTHATSALSACTRPIPTLSTSRRWDTSGATTPSAASSVLKDGGRTWDKVLYRSEQAGRYRPDDGSDQPARALRRVLGRAQRGPHFLRSAADRAAASTRVPTAATRGPRSRATPACRSGVLGKIGVAASPRTGRVWALIEAEDGALFRSDDGGATWERQSELPDLRRRAWYYTHIFADPQDADTVYVLNLKFWKSIDGGKTFSAIPTPHGDNQDLWIDPRTTSA